jgi:hypothetical protein
MQSDYVEYRIRSVIDITDGPDFHMVVVIDDVMDDSAANVTTQWAAKEFDLSDLVGSTGDDARVTITVNDTPPLEMTGETLFLTDPVEKALTETSVVSVSFSDLPAAS